MAELFRHYYWYWTSLRVRGQLPVLINDPDLAFRFFLQAHFPVSEQEPASIVIHRIPPLPETPDPVQQPESSPWSKLDEEMAKSGLEWLALFGHKNGDVEARFMMPRVIAHRD